MTRLLFKRITNKRKFTIFVHNNMFGANRMETFRRESNQPMPYNVIVDGKPTLTVKQFRGGSVARTLYTNRTAMETWNKFYVRWQSEAYPPFVREGINIEAAFRRFWERASDPNDVARNHPVNDQLHGDFSQHYAGLAFDVGHGQGIMHSEFRKIALREKNLIGQVGWRQIYAGGNFVHMDAGLHRDYRRMRIKGYPNQQLGDIGVYVFIIQDAMRHQGLCATWSGEFDIPTHTAVRQFQQTHNLTVDGIIGQQTWHMIHSRVHGGRQGLAIS